MDIERVMKLREAVEFRDLIQIVKAQSDKNISYCIYSDIDDSADLTLHTICYLDDYPEITDDDLEIYPEFVIKHGLSLLFREELVQDVIHHVLHQKPSATGQEILEAIIFYDTNDTFMDFNP